MQKIQLLFEIDVIHLLDNRKLVVMKQEVNYSRYVDRYLDGVMSDSEQIWFEKELDDNAALKSELAMQQKIKTVLQDTGVLDLQVQLDEIYKKTYNPWKDAISIKSTPMRVLAGIAAGIIIAVVLVTTLSRKTTSQDLFAEYYKPAEINMNFRTAEDIVDSELRKAMVFYESKNYNQAIVLFEKILKSDNTRVGLNLYSGISRMEINQYDEANRNFSKIIDHKANAFVESAQWYLGLCYIMTNEVDRARDVFTSIVKSDGYYKKDARRILKKISN
jgi:tetratricopeptide (TPR) repeat protein